LIEVLDAHVEMLRRNPVVFDLTCLTKVHTIALADWLASRELPSVTLAYTEPQEYRTPSQFLARGGRWLDVLVAPIRYAPETYASGSSALVIPGHDGGRLRLALDEYEVAYATILSVDTPARPVLTAVQRTRNDWLYDEISVGRYRHWKSESVAQGDSTRVGEIVSEICGHAIVEDLRFALFPFGPKSIVFAATFEAAIQCPERIWFAVPIPLSYDIEYTAGVGSTFWANTLVD